MGSHQAKVAVQIPVQKLDCLEIMDKIRLFKMN